MILFVLAFLQLNVNAYSSDLLLILNSERDAIQLDIEKTKSIFLKRERFWPDGVRVTVLERKRGSKERQQFNKRVLRASEVELIDYWLEAKQKMGVTRPLAIDSDATLLNVVESEAGAIGYLEGNLEVLNPALKGRRLRLLKVSD